MTEALLALILEDRETDVELIVNELRHARVRTRLEQARRYVTEQSGKHFEPLVAQVFVEMKSPPATS